MKNLRIHTLIISIAFGCACNFVCLGNAIHYNYNNPFQISNLQDDNYRTEGNVANDLTKKNHAYGYDLNGNLIYVNTAREKENGTQTEKSNERKLLWDEENRLEAINDNGFVSNYWYDAAGERTVKTSGESEQMYVNGLFSGGNTGTENFTAYISPYLVVSKGGNYTKHIYIGSQRVVSKLGDLSSYGPDPRRVEYAGANITGTKVDYKAKYAALQQVIKDRYAKFEVPYYGKDNDDYVNGQGFCCNDAPGLRSFGSGQNDNPELFQYYYHSDHLGSTGLITNLDGETVQHIEYVPFGEVFIEERNNTWNTPYLFNAKELDEETGLYFYENRYYDPRISIFISPDPLQEKYPNKTTYHYCSNNPVNRIDPMGLTDFEINGERKTIDDGRNNITIQASERQYNKARQRFADGERSYEKYLNKLFKNNEYTSIDIGYVTNDENYIIGREVTITKHNSRGSGVDWDKVVQDADDFFVVAAMADAQLPVGDAVGLIWKGASRLGRFLFGGTKAAKTGTSFFEGTSYTTKVLGQMKSEPFHAFPESVKAFESSGVISTIKGGDGITRQMLKISGEYGGKKGFFEFIKEADGSINHRFFRPNP